MTETKVKEHPILFSGPMVRAILEGRKTQTRRVVKGLLDGEEPGPCNWSKTGWGNWHNGGCSCRPIPFPYGWPGDLLWVRETFRETGSAQQVDGKLRGPLDPEQIVYYADDKAALYDGPWRPSIYMPRWASRLTLRITDVRVQRVQEMTLGDAKAEGLPNDEPIGQWFPMLWDSINAKRGYSWDVNPWVWAISFERVA